VIPKERLKKREEELVSLFVSCPLVRKAVSAAIEFDSQFFFAPFTVLRP
jgi:hypothetical protein